MGSFGSLFTVKWPLKFGTSRLGNFLKGFFEISRDLEIPTSHGPSDARYLDSKISRYFDIAPRIRTHTHIYLDIFHVDMCGVFGIY